jgi:hypothetical protein
MFDRRLFYAQVRQAPFGGHLDQGQVNGIEALLSKGLAEDLDLRWVAYVLGTAFHETARTMEPIEEYGRGAGRPYGVPDPRTGKTYFGRGFVQLTWEANYAAMGKLIGADLVDDPALALNLTDATEIIYVGMTDGTFTGGRCKLSDFFDAERSDWYNARRIVNGLDQAAAIAGYGLAFYKAALVAHGHAPASDTERDRPPGQPPPETYVDAEKQAVVSAPEPKCC